jgi:hypothetical protein
LNGSLDQIDIKDIYRTLHATAAEYAFSSSANGIFSRREQMIDYKINLNKLKQFKIISSVIHYEQ